MAAIPDEDARCFQIEALIASGKRLCESYREIGISEKTSDRRHRAQDGGE